MKKNIKYELSVTSRLRATKKVTQTSLCIILIQYKIAAFRALFLIHACVYHCTFSLVSSPLVYHCRFDLVHMSAQSKIAFSSLTLCGLVCTESAHVWNRGFSRLTRFFMNTFVTISEFLQLQTTLLKISPWYDHLL